MDGSGGVPVGAQVVSHRWSAGVAPTTKTASEIACGLDSRHGEWPKVLARVLPSRSTSHCSR